MIVLLGLTSMALLCLVTQATLQDSQVELETYRQTRQGLDEMYNVVWKQYNEEKRIRQVRNSKLGFILVRLATDHEMIDGRWQSLSCLKSYCLYVCVVGRMGFLGCFCTLLYRFTDLPF